MKFIDREFRSPLVTAIAAGVLVASFAFAWSNPMLDPPLESGTLFAPETGPFAGNIGVGTSTPGSKLSVFGGVSIGKNYIGTPAPKDGLIIEGSVGVGQTSPIAKLGIEGGITLGRTLVSGTPNNRVPLPNVIKNLNLPQSGRSIATAIGSDGFPIIVYYEGANEKLYFLKCKAIDCSGGETPTLIQSGTAVSSPGSVIVGRDGFPVIAYNFVDPTTGAVGVRIAKCDNPLCSNVPQIGIINNGGYNAFNPSIQINPATGFPMVAYYDGSPSKALKFAKCGDDVCQSATVKVLDTNVKLTVIYDAAAVVSLSVGYDGNPILIYRYRPSATVPSALRFIRCADDSCGTIAAGPTALAVSSANGDGSFASSNSLTIGHDGFPLMAYLAAGTYPRVIHCGDLNCTPALTSSTAIDANPAGKISITIGADNFPAIGYLSTGSFKVVKCSSSDCTAMYAPAVVVDAVSQLASLFTGVDELLVTAYRDSSDDDIKFVKCGSTRCLPYWGWK